MKKFRFELSLVIEAKTKQVAKQEFWEYVDAAEDDDLKIEEVDEENK